MYSIVRYRFLSLTPSMVSREILSNIDEGIILLDPHREVIMVNEKTKEIIGKDYITIEDIRKSIDNYDEYRKNIDMLLEKEREFTYRLNFFDKNNEKICIDARYSIIKYKFKDTLGILIIAKEVKGVKQLKTAFKLTDREINIILNLISGMSNSKISEKLSITVNTLKRHISNIYIKMNIYNKIPAFKYYT